MFDLDKPITAYQYASEAAKHYHQQYIEQNQSKRPIIYQIKDNMKKQEIDRSTRKQQHYREYSAETEQLIFFKKQQAVMEQNERMDFIRLMRREQQKKIEDSREQFMSEAQKHKSEIEKQQTILYQTQLQQIKEKKLRKTVVQQQYRQKTNEAQQRRIDKIQQTKQLELYEMMNQYPTQKAYKNFRRMIAQNLGNSDKLNFQK